MEVEPHENPYRPPQASLEPEASGAFAFDPLPFPLSLSRGKGLGWRRGVVLRSEGLEVARLAAERRGLRRYLRLTTPRGDSLLRLTEGHFVWEVAGIPVGSLAPWYPSISVSLRPAWEGRLGGGGMAHVRLRSARVLTGRPPVTLMDGARPLARLGAQVVLRRASEEPLLWVERPFLSRRAHVSRLAAPATDLEDWLGVLCVALQLR